MKNAYFAGGCFWCISNVFTSINGVKDVVSGYSGGKEINPAYDEVKHQQTGHRETIKIIYDEHKVSFEELLEIFFNSVDPFDKDGQFIDRGHSYTLAIYFTNKNEQEISNLFLEKKQKLNKKKIQISVEKFDTFYRADEYHQRWSEKHPKEFIEEIKDSGRLK